MTTNLTPAGPGTAADRELMAAARLMLQRMGVDPADLMTDPAERPPVPTFDVNIPEVEKAISPATATATAYSSYWNRILANGPRTLLAATATEIKQFGEEIKTTAPPLPHVSHAAAGAPPRTSSPPFDTSTATPRTTD